MGSNLREGKGERETGGVTPTGCCDSRATRACPLSEQGRDMDARDALRATRRVGRARCGRRAGEQTYSG